jgi:hypothetical protein
MKMKKYIITIAEYAMMGDRPTGLVEFIHEASSASVAYEVGKVQGKTIFPKGCSVEAREIFTVSWIKLIFGIGR